MAKKIFALVKPELLIWARNGTGLSIEEAAKKAAVKSEKLEAWEAGDGHPTISQLRKLAQVYKRPLAVFYLQKAPKDFQVMHDFRRLPGEVAGIASPELRLEIRKTRYRRQVAVELFRELGEAMPTFETTATITEDPDVVAQRAREALGITYQAQRAWRTDYDGLNAWRAALEQCGILVFQASGISLSEMRGFSISKSPLPAIVVNVKDTPRGRTFTMAHELVHLMLREEGLCDLTEDASRPPAEQRVEVFCNRVAGAILVPAENLLAEDLLASRGASPAWSDDELLTLARRYQVSREVILRRLLVMGKTTEAFYQQKRREFLAIYRQREEQQRDKESGFVPPDRKAVSATGTFFARLVLDSFHQEKITSSDVSDYLGIRLKWMPQIEAAVFRTHA
jgi:Zn-dependent peptidase ImmA (M78 family)/transcriptional regulator with XRE-family HTH domain